MLCRDECEFVYFVLLIFFMYFRWVPYKIVILNELILCYKKKKKFLFSLHKVLCVCGASEKIQVSRVLSTSSSTL